MAMLEEASSYEKVHTCTDYYDGPRQGIANLGGKPHFYESEWDDEASDYASTFLLTPVADDLLPLALEDCQIWLRWQVAFREGRTTQETHPALPEDRDRHEELKTELTDRLATNPDRAVRARGDFRVVPGAAPWKGPGIAPLEVRWEVVSS